MVKPIITANEVREARKAGRTELIAPAGALVTPQARDDARDFGIRLIEETGLAAAPSHAAASAPVVLGGSVPGRITLYAGKPFEEATACAPATACLQPMPGAGTPGTPRAPETASQE